MGIAYSFLFLRLSAEKNNSVPSSVLSGSNVQIGSAIIAGEGGGLFYSLNDLQIIPNSLQNTSPFYTILLQKNYFVAGVM